MCVCVPAWLRTLILFRHPHQETMGKVWALAHYKWACEAAAASTESNSQRPPLGVTRPTQRPGATAHLADGPVTQSATGGTDPAMQALCERDVG